MVTSAVAVLWRDTPAMNRSASLRALSRLRHGYGLDRRAGTAKDGRTSAVYVMVVCGILSQDERLRKNVMHVAAVVGLLGFFGALWRPAKALIQNGSVDLNAVAVRLQLMTALLCLVFVVLCVQSFVAARRGRA